MSPKAEHTKRKSVCDIYCSREFVIRSSDYRILNETHTSFGNGDYFSRDDDVGIEIHRHENTDRAFEC